MRYFEEIQKFDQWWFKLIIYGTLLFTIGSMLFAFQEVKEDEMNSFLWTTIPAIVIVALVTLLLITLQLKTKIDDVGIHYGFTPFQRKLKTAKWHDIASCNVTKYSPMRDYGGWGYKYSLKGKGKVYSTKGNMGIKIVFKSGAKTMIGTQKPEDAKLVIKRYLNT